MPLLALMVGTLLCLQNSVEIGEFGAVPDGRTLNTEVFRKAIESAQQRKARIVTVPPGTYLTGTIRIPSGIELHLKQGAVILGSPHHADYLRGVWPALILAADADNISITGAGTIDGQGAEVAKDVLHLVQIGKLKIPAKGWRPSEVDRPEVIEFTRCHHVRIQGVTLKNSTCWVQTYRNCTDLSIEDETVDSKTYWNNDGIDIVDCQRVKITGCNIDSNDDGICLKSVGPKAACEDIEVRQCKVRSSASAIKFGTSSGGGFRRIHIDGVSIHDTFRSAIALESVDGGTLEDVLIENVSAKHTGNPFFIRLGHRNLRASVGRVRRVKIRNLDVEVPEGRPDFGYPFKGPQFGEPHNIEPSSIIGHRDSAITDISLENIKLTMPGGSNPSIARVRQSEINKIPERPTDYPEFTMLGELPAWGVYIRHAKGIQLKNIQIVLKKPEFRAAIVLDDAHEISMKDIKISGAETLHKVILRHSFHVSVPPHIHKSIVRS